LQTQSARVITAHTVYIYLYISTALCAQTPNAASGTHTKHIIARENRAETERERQKSAREGTVFEEGNIKRAAEFWGEIITQPCVAHRVPVGRVPRADQRDRPVLLKQSHSTNRVEHIAKSTSSHTLLAHTHTYTYNV